MIDNKLSKAKHYQWGDCLQKESRAQPLGDCLIESIYYGHPGVSYYSYNRFSYDEHPDLQKADIDSQIVADNEIISISEKYRYSCFDDIMIELYSDVEKRKPGWALISKADYLHYFKINESEMECEADVVKMTDILRCAHWILDDLSNHNIDINKLDWSTNTPTHPYPDAEYGIGFMPSYRGWNGWVGMVATIDIRKLIDLTKNPVHIYNTNIYKDKYMDPDDKIERLYSDGFHYSRYEGPADRGHSLLSQLR